MRRIVSLARSLFVAPRSRSRASTDLSRLARPASSRTPRRRLASRPPSRPASLARPATPPRRPDATRLPSASPRNRESRRLPPAIAPRVARESQIQTLSFVVARARVARSPVARAPSTHRALDRVLRSREVPHVPRHRARRRRAAPSSAARASPIARAPPTLETVARYSSRVFEYARLRVHSRRRRP